MAKIILVALIALAVYLLVRSRRSSRAPRPSSNEPAKVVEDVVACGRCGLRVPMSESVEIGGRRYCCPEHGRLG